MKSSPNACAPVDIDEQTRCLADKTLDEMLVYSQPESWNLAARRIRAKTIPLGERPITSQVPAERRTSIDDCIDEQSVAQRNDVHGRHCVQCPPYEPTALERLILSKLNEVESTPAWRVAELANVKPRIATSRLEKLAAKQLVVGEQWRGYRLAGKR